MFKNAVENTKTLLSSWSADLTIFIIGIVASTFIVPLDPFNLSESGFSATGIYTVISMLIVILFVFLNYQIIEIRTQSEIKRLTSLTKLRTKGIRTKDGFARNIDTETAYIKKI